MVTHCKTNIVKLNINIQASQHQMEQNNQKLTCIVLHTLPGGAKNVPNFAYNYTVFQKKCDHVFDDKLK